MPKVRPSSRLLTNITVVREWSRDSSARTHTGATAPGGRRRRCSGSWCRSGRPGWAWPKSWRWCGKATCRRRSASGARRRHAPPRVPGHIFGTAGWCSPRYPADPFGGRSRQRLRRISRRSDLPPRPEEGLARRFSTFVVRPRVRCSDGGTHTHRAAQAWPDTTVSSVAVAAVRPGGTSRRYARLSRRGGVRGAHSRI